MAIPDKYRDLPFYPNVLHTLDVRDLVITTLLA
jgi:hypothetical protein